MITNVFTCQLLINIYMIAQQCQACLIFFSTFHCTSKWVHPLVLRTYKESQEMPLKNNNPPPHPPYSDPGNWRKQYLAETRLSHLFSPLLGECPLYLVYLQYPFVFLCFIIQNLPILVVTSLFQTFCCSHFILSMDIIHLLVPSVAAVYERHMETYVNLPPYHPNSIICKPVGCI